MNSFQKINIGIAILLVAAVLPFPYEYYIFLRAAVFAYALLLIYGLSGGTSAKLDSLRIWVIAIAILYNPIFPLYLTKFLWVFINMATAVFFYKKIDPVLEKLPKK